ncbi:MAG TPA: pantoate--beta-alanine ligase [Bacteroidales bacterium]|nr:pantoate--beta-alanine ligase [Bacteroidales bacterium]
MQTVLTVRKLRMALISARLSPVGFVPTMGALHQGHLSLVRNAMESCPVVVVSIYVNPTQFNDRDDLKNYPRTPESDLDLLGGMMREKDIVFMPEDKEIYPEEDSREFRFGNLDNVMEALHRPGHFNGVAQVVSRLFDIVKPDKAFFGQKDFQQLAVIKELVKQTGSKVEIIGNPIIREADGLAMSSRNRRLEPELRTRAGIIYSALSDAAGMIRNHDIPAIREHVVKKIENAGGFIVEYFEIADDIELKPVHTKAALEKGKRYYGCIAVKAGSIRLIDNVEVPVM